MTPKVEKKDSSVSIFKGLCIILMVIGHSGAPKYISNFIYLFHMPAFFFISGYFLTDWHIENLFNTIKKRYKKLYIPFILWSLIFILLHNIFYNVGFYTEKYDSQDILFKVLEILSLRKTEQLLGGFWFLRELLFASILSTILMYFFKNKPNKNITPIYISSFLLISIILSVLPLKIPYITSLTLLAGTFYLSGYYFKTLNYNFKNPLLLGFIVLGILSFFPFFFSTTMLEVKGYKIVLFFITGILGSVMVYLFSHSLKKETPLAKILIYTGNTTMTILIFHFFSFKIVSYFLIKIMDYPINRLTEFPVLRSGSFWFWILYSIIGVIIPIYIGLVLSKFSIGLKEIFKRK